LEPLLWGVVEDDPANTGPADQSREGDDREKEHDGENEVRSAGAHLHSGGGVSVTMYGLPLGQSYGTSISLGVQQSRTIRFGAETSWLATIVTNMRTMAVSSMVTGRVTSAS
jgi:hypothetical protein